MDKKIALVSGANRGIGLATVAALAEKGVQVLLGARDLEKGKVAAKTLQDKGLDVEAVQLDTTDEASVTALVKTLDERFGKIDILVNNAGIALDYAPDMTTAEKLMGTFDVNVAGTARMTDHMVALLEKSDHARIVNVSSALASFGLRHDPSWIYKDIKMPTYAASKAALNAMIVSYTEELAEKGIKVHGVCPGLTATEATGYQGRPVEEAIQVIIKFALLVDASITGTFENDEGTIPW